MSEPDLFDYEPTPPFSRHGTSEEAAESMPGAAATSRARILRLCIQRGLQGLTCYEAEKALGMPNENGCHPRFWELATLSNAPAARKTRLIVPRQLFVIDKDVALGEIRRKSGKSGRSQLVYFAYAAVSEDQVLAHYGLRRRLQ